MNCRINGTFWEAKNTIIDGTSDPISASLDLNKFLGFTFIGGQILNDDSQTLTLSVHQLPTASRKFDPRDFDQGILFNRNQDASYILDTSQPAEIEFTTLDTVDHFAEGTFHFGLVNSNGETLKVTDGSFSIDYEH